MNDEEMEKSLRSLKDLPRVSEERREAAFERVRAEWQAGLATRAAASKVAPRRRWPLAAAASVLIASLSGLSLWLSQDSPRSAIAMISAVNGEGALRVDDVVHADQLIESGSSTLAIKLSSGLVVRVAPDSALTFGDTARLALERGRIFVDSNPAQTKAPLLVQTALGEVRHIGTRYLVEYDRRELQIAVREGMIALQRSDGSPLNPTAEAGEQLTVSSSAPTEIERTAVSVSDARWRWIERVPSPLDIDGQPLSVFLQWYEQETGRRVTLRGVSPQTTLNGNIAGLPPDDALDAIALAVELEVDRENESVLLRMP
jgi:ferric-dicitrate binding protein FerR (iron transport regulator)